MSRYAADTAVSAEKSRMEIELILKRYKASHFGYATGPEGARVMFILNGRQIRFDLPLPDPKDRTFAYTPGRGQLRTDEGRVAAWEQACRQRWRALALVIKAKLEAVDTGITTVEDEFLAQTVASDGRTVSEIIQPQMKDHYLRGGPPTLMIEAQK